MSEPESAARTDGPGAADAAPRRTFRRHLALFVGGNVALGVANYFIGGGWWAFWPLVAWGVVLMVHYLRYKAAAVDDAWVDARTAELRLKSYDRDHIENIAAHGPGSAGRRDAPTE